MTLGERVKLKREELGFSQEELAEKMGYKSKTSIHKIEQGITDLPLSKVAELAKILGVTSSYLMGSTEKYTLAHEVGHLSLSPRFRWVARNAKKMSDEDLLKLQNLMKAAFEKIDFDEEE